MKQFFIVLPLVFVLSCSASRFTMTKIEAVGDYYHDSTQTTFPEKFGEMIRTEIISYNNHHTNIGVSYYDPSTSTKITVYVYPAGTATEYRLINEYFFALQSIANTVNEEIKATQSNFPFSKDGYRVIGITAHMERIINSQNSVLSIFECGPWFLKYRITSSLDLKTIEGFQNRLLEIFSPIDLVKKYPLKQNSTVWIAPAALKDSSMLYSTLFWAYGKAGWVHDSVDSLERCSGFPSLYLEEHVRPIANMISKWDSSRYGHKTTQFEPFKSLKKIADAGFLNELIMDEYSMLLITPKDLKLDIQAYREWKKKNLPGFNLHSKLFLLEYTK